MTFKSRIASLYLFGVIASLQIGCADDQKTQTSASIETKQKHNPIPPNALIVSKDGSSEFSSITEAISSAESGDTIMIQPGVYKEHLEIDKNITIQGVVPGSLSDLENLWRIFVKDSEMMAKIFEIGSEITKNSCSNLKIR